ncbi:Vesicular-fusion protein SEC18 [Wickerhamiella sorbophila]|uniref:Vesicular-fusion protein SEC18 n=1 Tax=Wickerhamiella sorbophila TaxID=45607 RepID=A0A2T0FFY5_9ASCO|nr:Vesicular-fusion protein SEC18 [Wickerhamiella sorbophila]PRT53906.1 Vesicular-fusion protein SEC18 [Wickerhamiella sorbophila]
MMGKFGFSKSGSGEGHHTESYSPTKMLEVVNAPIPSIVLNNVLAIPPNTLIACQYVICDNRYVFSVQVVPSMAPNTLGVGGPQREWAQWTLRQQVSVTPFDIFAGGNTQVYLAAMEIEVDFYNRSKATNTPYDQEALAKIFRTNFQDRIFSPGQMFAMDVGGVNFKAIVRHTQVVDMSDFNGDRGENKRGIVLSQTEVNFVKAANSLMQLKGGSNRARTNLLMPNFKFESLGVGGLDEEFSTIFRRAFASRIAPPDYIEKLGIRHVKGILLYGPPGTGKTLIARQIAKMLNTVEPKIVNGPEMLSKFVGGSEENIRKLFADAEAEFKSKGDDSNLHIIIFDELDAVFKQRGSRSDGTGVGDNVVNQLLAKMDGVDQLNNVLIIGMTNRRDLIDSALLRPGRFEVQVEIPLPDENGRRQIFEIHTANMRKNHMMAKDVDLGELAALAKNYSGAEIEGCVNMATSYPMGRALELHKGSTKMDFKKEESLVTRADFLEAIKNLKPAFGVSEADLTDVIKYDVLRYSPKIEDILLQGEKLINLVKMSDTIRLVSALMYGAPGAGKSSLAAQLALTSGFPLVKMISPDSVAGMSEQQKVNHIQQVFLDAYKSPLSAVIVDQLEDIIEYNAVGPRFSNTVIQVINVCVQRYAPHGHRLLVLATSSDFKVMESLGMAHRFYRQLYVPNIHTLNELQNVLELADFSNPACRRNIVETIRKEVGSESINMGIKQVVTIMEEAVANAPDDVEQEFVKQFLLPQLEKSYEFANEF